MWKYLSLRAQVIGILCFGPLISCAAAPTDFKGVVALFLGYLKMLIPLIFGLTFIVLIWGIVQAWIFNGGNTEKIAEGQQIALWGVIGLVVMVGLWGIIALLRTSLFGNI